MAVLTDRDLQQLQELGGYRQAGATGRAALRLDDMSGLLQIAATLKSAKAAGSAPTKAEFDALVEDVQMIFLRLQAVVRSVRARRGR